MLRQQFGVIDDLRGVEIAGKTDTGIVHQILRKQNIAVTRGNDIARSSIFISNFWRMNCRSDRERCSRAWQELLPRLQARPQNVLALLTGNLRRGAQLKLAHYGIWDFFEFGAFADDHHDRNQLGPFAQQRARDRHAIDFAAADIDVIGDTPHDIACGKAIGARTDRGHDRKFFTRAIGCASAGLDPR